MRSTLKHLQAIRGLGLLNDMWLNASNCVAQCYAWADHACTQLPNANEATVSSTLGLEVLVQHMKMHRSAQRQIERMALLAAFHTAFYARGLPGRVLKLLVQLKPDSERQPYNGLSLEVSRTAAGTMPPPPSRPPPGHDQEVHSRRMTLCKAILQSGVRLNARKKMRLIPPPSDEKWLASKWNLTSRVNTSSLGTL